MRVVSLLGVAISLMAVSAPSATVPDNGIPDADRVRLAEVFRLASEVGDSVWAGWSSAPFAMLLVTADQEFLIRHPAPTPDFTRVGYDPLLHSDVFVRKRTFATSFLATFPAVGETPTIVVGELQALISR